MSDEVQEPNIEVSAPPKSIEIQSSSEVEESVASPVMQNQGAMLTGGIGQMQGNLMAAQPQNVKFVMGPNGQMIAIEKPPFVWKHFFIGGGIPFVIFFVPLLILMIGTGLGYDDYIYENQQVTLNKDENSTTYRGQLTVEEDYFLLEECSIQNSQDNESINVYCERYDDYKARIKTPVDAGNQTVGNWNNENGTVYLDTGIDYGEELEVQMEFRTDSDSNDFFMIVGDISSATCCLGLLLSIVFLIVGFSQGKPGMGWGGATALVSLPVVSFISLVLMW